MGFFTAAFVLFMVSTSAFSVSFMPENNLHLEDNLTDSTIDQESFKQIIYKAWAFYSPIVTSHGARLVIDGNWGSSTVNAYASRSGSTWHVQMLGGLARRVTPDAFALVICHELGHHLGGFPWSGWAANEGQSDYFGTQSCSRELWRDEVSENAKFRETIAEVPKRFCDSQWKGWEEQNLCYRSMEAGLSLATLLGRGVGYSTPDKNKVSRTNSRHPAAQCRLDTYIAGALCIKDFDVNRIPLNEAAMREQSCGNRPRCWFYPSN